MTTPAHTLCDSKPRRPAKPPLHGDPLLDEVHELLHRVLDCPSGETTHWMVRQALARLRMFEAKASSEAN